MEKLNAQSLTPSQYEHVNRNGDPAHEGRLTLKELTSEPRELGVTTVFLCPTCRKVVNYISKDETVLLLEEALPTIKEESRPLFAEDFDNPTPEQKRSSAGQSKITRTRKVPSPGAAPILLNERDSEDQGCSPFRDLFNQSARRAYTTPSPPTPPHQSGVLHRRGYIGHLVREARRAGDIETVQYFTNANTYGVMGSHNFFMF